MRRLNLMLPAFAALLSLCVGPVLAEEVAAPGQADDAVEIDLGEIEIEGSTPVPAVVAEDDVEPPDLSGLTAEPLPPRIAAQAQVISAEEISASGSASVAELLQRSTGFVVSDSFSGSSASFQGLPSKFTTVLLDGQRVPGSILERADLSQLRLDNVERIEVLRGPQASAFSGSSIGAVVNIITRQSAGAETSGSLSLGLGSLGYGRARLSVAGGSEDAHESWMLALERSARGRYDLDPRLPDTDGDGYQQSGLFGKWSKDIGPNSLRLQLDWFDEQRRGNSYAPPDLLRNLDTGTRRFQADAAWRWRLDGGGLIELRHNFGSYNHGLRRYYLGFEDQSTVFTGFTDSLHDSHLSFQEHADGSGLAAGVIRSQNKLSSDRISVDGSGYADSEAWAAYLSQEWKLDERWRLGAALRYDAAAGFSGQLSPRASLGYSIDQRSGLSLGVGRGYRTPSLREQYYEFASPFGYSVVGNRDLLPESSWDFGLDYDYAGSKGKLHAGWFYHRVQDLIDFTQIQTSPQVFQTVNVGTALSCGVELSAERRWTISYDGEHEVASSWGTGFDSMLLLRSSDQSTGNELPNAPQRSHALRVFYDENKAALHSQLSLRSVGGRWLDLENTDRAPAYLVLDASLSRDLGDGRIELAGLNLLNESDGRYGPEPGRELRAAYTWEF